MAPIVCIERKFQLICFAIDEHVSEPVCVLMWRVQSTFDHAFFRAQRGIGATYENQYFCDVKSMREISSSHSVHFVKCRNKIHVKFKWIRTTVLKLCQSTAFIAFISSVFHQMFVHLLAEHNHTHNILIWECVWHTCPSKLNRFDSIRFRVCAWATSNYHTHTHFAFIIHFQFKWKATIDPNVSDQNLDVNGICPVYVNGSGCKSSTRSYACVVISCMHASNESHK